MRSIIINSVVEKLKGITLDEEDNLIINDEWKNEEEIENHKPVLKHFAIWRENLLYSEEDAPYKLPAVFFEFEPIRPLPLPHKKREATVVMKLHILTEKSQDDIDGTYHEEKAYKLIEIINKALTLHSFEGEEGGHDSLTNFNSVEDYSEPEVDHYTESFRLRAWDDTSYTALQTVAPDPEMIAELDTVAPSGPAMYILKNTNGDDLKDGILQNGKTTPIIAPDAEYVAKYLNGTILDSGVIFSGKSKEIIVPNQIVPEGWYPPSQWNWDAVSSLISDGENGFVCIFSVFPGIPNYFAFTPTITGAITYTINWGNGEIESYSGSNVKCQKIINYDDVNGFVVDGYKVCVVRATFDGTITKLNFRVLHNNEISYSFAQKFVRALKIRSNLPSYMTFTFEAYSYNNFHLNILDINGANMNVAAGNLMQNLAGLKKLIWDFKHVTMAGACTSGCRNLKYDWTNGVANWGSFTNLGSMFSGFRPAETQFLDIAIPNCIAIGSTFYDSGAFHGVRLKNTSNVATIYQAINACETIIDFEMDNCANVSSTSLFLNIGVKVLRRIILQGLTIGIDLRNQPLTEDASNAFYGSLGFANGSQTINMTGVLHPGDKTIAENKGFTVLV